MFLTALVFLLLLSVLVLVHEAGHFLVAKKLGVKVEEFGFGLPPRLWGRKIGETVYSLNWLPIGGFVKLYGEDEAGGGNLKISKQNLNAKKDLKRAFFTKSAPERLAIVLAGVVMNLFLAVVIYYVFLAISGFKTELPLPSFVGNYHFFGVEQSKKSEIIVFSVAPKSPAANSGLAPYSRIVSLNGVKVTDASSFVATVKKNEGKNVSLVWQDLKSQKTHKVSLVPRKNPPKGEGSLGIGFASQETAVLSYKTLSQKIVSGFVHPANLLAYNLKLMAGLVSLSLKEKTSAPLAQGVSGPVGIYSVVGSIVALPDLKEKFLQGLNLAGILSISLAFFNVLPIPALDGGRAFFILVEFVLGKKINPRLEGYIHALGMAFLLALILLITLKDISQLFR